MGCRGHWLLRENSVKGDAPRVKVLGARVGNGLAPLGHRAGQGVSSQF